MAFIASKPEGTSLRAEVNKMPYIPSARDVTISYPVGLASLEMHLLPRNNKI